jgi:hypothetical protein
MPNPFCIGDIVKTMPATQAGVALTQRAGGKVKYIACVQATQAGGRTCDKKTCGHIQIDYIWVLYPGSHNTISYHYTDLEFDVAPAKDAVEVIPDKSVNAAIDGFKEKLGEFIKDAPSKGGNKGPIQLDELDFSIYNGLSKEGDYLHPRKGNYSSPVSTARKMRF